MERLNSDIWNELFPLFETRQIAQISSVSSFLYKYTKSKLEHRKELCDSKINNSLNLLISEFDDYIYSDRGNNPNGKVFNVTKDYE